MKLRTLLGTVICQGTAAPFKRRECAGQSSNQRSRDSIEQSAITQVEPGSSLLASKWHGETTTIAFSGSDGQSHDFANSSSSLFTPIRAGRTRS